MRDRCSIPGCDRLAAAKGKCTHHLGLVTDDRVSTVNRHRKMIGETMKFDFVNEPPGRAVLAELTDIEQQLVAACRKNPLQWTRYPFADAVTGWGELSTRQKANRVKSQSQQVQRSGKWRVNGGELKAATRGTDLYVSFVPTGWGEAHAVAS